MKHAPLFLLMFVAGCESAARVADNSDADKIYGKVTFKEEPLTFGTIIFTSVDDRKTYGALIEPDGKFQFYPPAKPKPGKYKVTVSLATVAAASMSAKKDGPGKSKDGKGIVLPDRYKSPDTTDLEAEVRGGDLELNFDLKSQ
jgi:hypothetical protein